MHGISWIEQPSVVTTLCAARVGMAKDENITRGLLCEPSVCTFDLSAILIVGAQGFDTSQEAVKAIHPVSREPTAKPSGGRGKAAIAFDPCVESVSVLDMHRIGADFCSERFVHDLATDALSA